MLHEGELAELLNAMAAGERSAAEALYRRMGARLYGSAYRILRDAGLAEDAVQEAFVKIWRNAHRFDAAKGLPSTWMAVIVRRVALDRRPRAVSTLPADLEAPALDLDYVHPRLRDALAELPEVHRNALVLMYVHGLSHSELAQAMGAPLGTVKSWVRRASAALKEKLER
ncbi:RNA polymerase sigma factor [Phenylobacterium sp.]|uniref:RNA polymerase sigma factor n=1 Tax=Phenylobacterium sp. TaxID=1871053 RepID=UPI002DF178C6|nr:sigma-70 family RNA polymerase sigma factor [Phenylobacterium sp.]